MEPRELAERVLQLYHKCPLKTVACFGVDLRPWLANGFRSVDFEPKEGGYDLVIQPSTYLSRVWFKDRLITFNETTVEIS